MRTAVIELPNGVKGLVFIRDNISEMISFIKEHREKPEEIIKYHPSIKQYSFGKNNAPIEEGDSIIYNPFEDSFHLSRNPRWIDDYYFKY